MRIKLQISRQRGGYALLVTLVFLGIMLVILTSMIRLTATQSALTARNNFYNAAVAAAEGASEMAIAQIDRDFIYQSVNSDLNVYRNLMPALNQSAWPIQFEFSNGQGAKDLIGVESLGPAVIANLNSQFAGLYGLVTPYRITSTARTASSVYNVAATVSQDIQLASIPVFQFAIFYTLDLEINPGPVMTINGKVHSNGNIYTAPVAGLNFQDAVTSVGKIYNDRHPDDPQYGSAKVKPAYSAQHTEKVSSLTLPVGTDNNPATVREILKPAPVGEDPNSPTGKQRYYNKSDLIVTTTDAGVTVTTGAWNLYSVIKPDITNGSTPSYSFLKTDATFNDVREKKWTTTTEIDVAALNTWLKNPKTGAQVNNLASSTLGHGINALYVDDQRSSPSRLTTVRIVNGSTLPDDGLTVATAEPLYVKGNFNLNNGDTTVGQTDTSKTKPASLIGDSITVVSQSWDDANAGKALNKRTAANTTVNAALLGGIVKTVKQGNAKYYSGGAENFIRFMEDWAGKTLTYNGSMVVMFESQSATNWWQAPGIYYNAPNRKWAFDLNFLNQAKLPPGTPQVRKLVRGQWSITDSP